MNRKDMLEWLGMILVCATFLGGPLAICWAAAPGAPATKHPVRVERRTPRHCPPLCITVPPEEYQEIMREMREAGMGRERSEP